MKRFLSAGLGILFGIGFSVAEAVTIPTITDSTFITPLPTLPAGALVLDSGESPANAYANPATAPVDFLATNKRCPPNTQPVLTKAYRASSGALPAGSQFVSIGINCTLNTTTYHINCIDFRVRGTSGDTAIAMAWTIYCQ